MDVLFESENILSNLTPQYAKIPCEANEINGSRGIVVFHEHRTK